MGARGPKSKAELALVENNNTSAISRLRPPSQLSEYEQGIWVKTVNDRPANWFGNADIPTLTQYVRHISTSEMISQQIAKMKPAYLTKPDGLDRYDKLLKMQERETRAISALARSMRLTQQSTYNAKNANTLKHSEGGSDKPWEE